MLKDYFNNNAKSRNRQTRHKKNNGDADSQQNSQQNDQQHNSPDDLTASNSTPGFVECNDVKDSFRSAPSVLTPVNPGVKSGIKANEAMRNEPSTENQRSRDARDINRSRNFAHAEHDAAEENSDRRNYNNNNFRESSVNHRSISSERDRCNYRDNRGNRDRDISGKRDVNMHDQYARHKYSSKKYRDCDEDDTPIVRSFTGRVKDDDFDDSKIYFDDFESMDFLTDELFNGIKEYDFSEPSFIQSRTIPLMKHKKDLIAQSQSGTGKTGAFVIGGLSLIDLKKKHPQVIIIEPTKALACQTLKVANYISKNMNIRTCLCVGGSTFAHENATHVSNAQLLVGTPGRLSDLINRKAFQINNITTLILDEADELLKVDFRRQMKVIIESVSNTAQICLFSATFTKESLQMTGGFLFNPFRITVEKENLSLEGIEQYQVFVGYEDEKFNVLLDIFENLTISQMIIFVNTARTAIALRNRLWDKKKIGASLIHGDIENKDRESILTDFRLARTSILIATDVVCRGIDIDDLRIVINYDIPTATDTYLHRIGRSGRFGSKGIAINFCTHDDTHRIRSIENYYNVEVTDLPKLDYINDIVTGMTVPVAKKNTRDLYLDND